MSTNENSNWLKAQRWVSWKERQIMHNNQQNTVIEERTTKGKDKEQRQQQ